jgi:hypothetical protein
VKTVCCGPYWGYKAALNDIPFIPFCGSISGGMGGVTCADPPSELDFCLNSGSDLEEQQLPLIGLSETEIELVLEL